MTQSLRIVVADDEPDIRQFFQKILPRLGHRVLFAAANGRELVECCRALAPDLIITDNHMPEMDGLQAVAELQQEHTVPVIVISADPEPEALGCANPDQVMGYLVKPIKSADLEPAITLAWRRFQQRQHGRAEPVPLTTSSVAD